MLAISFKMLLVVKKWIKDENEEGGHFKRNFDDRPGSMFAIILLSIIGGISFISGTVDAITHFINPEFYAIEYFINLVK